jgi:glycosyltransferase involved in cell wall biosynthesis
MADSNPLVSIGIPVYNGEQVIRHALDSLLAQTYQNLELVVSDNASTDGTSAICLEYAARDSRVRYHRNAVNIGLIPNFRRLFKLSSGDYFMWAAADDLKPPTAVERCLEALLKNDRAVMAHGAVLVKSEGRESLVEITNEVDLSSPEAAERVRAFTKGVKHVAMLYGLYRRSALARGTLPNCRGQDYLLCLQMCLLGPLEYVRTPIVVYSERRPHPGNNPMYEELPLTVMSLLTRAGARKCWTVLFMGCYYLFKIHGISLAQQVDAITAHVSTFSLRYRTWLLKEVLFQLFIPAAWLCVLCWRLARHWSFSMSLVRKLRVILTEP